MAPNGKITLKLGNRSAKQPIKNLPSTVEITADTTVQDLKHLVAKAAKISDFNRIGVFDPNTKKTFKDRLGKLADEPAVASGGEVLIKDLGFQIDWKTVFLVEYAGPLLAHPLFIAARPYIYRNGTGEMSTTQWLSMYMIMVHFIKRVVETQFVHKFSANTMPLRNIFKNSAHYWIVSGVYLAYFLYSPAAPAATAENPIVDYVGLALFVFGEVNNLLVHLYLATLRSTGGTERQIPAGFSFSLVTCPNYMFEIIAWIGVLITSRSLAVVVFLIIGAGQMYLWAKGKESRYRKEFGDKYKKKRFVMLPGLL